MHSARLFVVPSLAAFLAALVAVTPAHGQSLKPGGDPGPKPHADCKLRTINYGDMRKLPDVDAPAPAARYYWDCPEDHPKLTAARARHETRYRMLDVAYHNINRGAYNYGVKSCKRKNRLKFRCIGFFDAEGHIRCTQRYRVFRDDADDVRSRYVAGSTTCSPSSKARF